MNIDEGVDAPPEHGIETTIDEKDTEARLEAPPEEAALRAAAAASREKAAIAAASMEAVDSDLEEGTPRKGSGWWGSGEPMSIGSAERKRPFYDGAGLCSPGRWPPDRRRLPRDGAVAILRERILEGINEWTRRSGLKPDGILAGLASGDLREDPFLSDITEGIRGVLSDFLSSAGHEVCPRPDDQPQPVAVRLLGAFLKDAGDPDADVMDTYARGVRIGVGVRLPRTPAIYDRKVAWRLPSQRDPEAAGLDPDPAGVWNANYVSVKPLRKEVEQELEDQTERGQILKLSEAEARRRFGSSLVVAPLAAIVKAVRDDGSVQIRLLFGGTRKVPVNDRIQVRG